MTNLLIALCLASITAAPRVFTLDAGADVQDYTLTDLTGNGQSDILVLCDSPGQPDTPGYVGVFLAREGGGYPARPDFRFDLPRDTAVLFLADTDGAPPHELLVGSADGVRVFHYEDRAFRFRALHEAASLYPRRARQPIFVEDRAFDVTNDGTDEWLLPVEDGYELHGANGLVLRLPCEVTSNVRLGSIGHRLPDVVVFEYEGRTSGGVAFLGDEHVDFYFDEGWRGHARAAIPSSENEDWGGKARLVQLDGEGVPDLLMSQVKGRFRVTATTALFRTGPDFQLRAEPDQLFSVRGAVTSPFLEDVDGDGLQDLMFAKVTFGVRSLVTFFMRQKVNIQLAAHMNRNGRFSPDPDYEAAFILDVPEDEGEVANTFGDFNGDGRLDVAFRDSDGNLAIHLGHETRLFEPRPWVVIDVPATGRARTHDLTGDGQDAIIIVHPNAEEQDRLRVVLF